VTSDIRRRKKEKGRKKKEKNRNKKEKKRKNHSSKIQALRHRDAKWLKKKTRQNLEVDVCSELETWPNLVAESPENRESQDGAGA